MDKHSNREVEVTGLDAFADDLDKLELWASQDVLNKSLMVGAEIVRDEAKDLAPIRTGKLRDAIKVRKGKSRKGSASVLVSVNDKWFEGDRYYAAFQEFGWHSGKRKSFGKGQKGKAQGRKFNEGEHYLQNATEAVQDQAINAIINELRKRIDTELGR